MPSGFKLHRPYINHEHEINVHFLVVIKSKEGDGKWSRGMHPKVKETVTAMLIARRDIDGYGE
jgi:hypothetical protein